MKQEPSILCKARRVTDTGDPEQCVRIIHEEGPHLWRADTTKEKQS